MNRKVYAGPAVSPGRNRRRSNGRRPSLSLRRPVCPAALATPSKAHHPSASNIKVMLRVRPPNRREVDDERFRDIVEVVDKNCVIFDPKEDEDPFFHKGQKLMYRDITKPKRKHMQFNFDAVFGPEESTPEVYESSIKALIPSLLNGYNCTVFAYGATGAGKTHTMLGSAEVPGVTPLLMAELYEQLDSLEYADVKIQVSYLEIYNELVHDLLVEKGQRKNLGLREDGNRVAVPGLSWLRPTTAQDLMDMLHLGNRRRTQHPTDANAESSRSHAVFQVLLTMKQQGHVRCAKLSMIDLAGSERAADTKNNKCRFKEGANINKSLLALGNCINSLADGLKHIPFRDSNLTRLLKGSLGGNCCTVMIANVSPSSLTYEDTYNTLKYATRAKKIKNRVKKNSVSVNLTTREYTIALEAAQAQIHQLQSQNKQLVTDSAALDARIVELQAENKALKEATPVSSWQEDITALQHQVAALEAENRALRCSNDVSSTSEDILVLKSRVMELETELSVLKATPPPTPPEKCVEAKVAPIDVEIIKAEPMLAMLLKKIQLLQMADATFKNAVDTKYHLLAQLECLEYNFKKKMEKIDKVNCLKKDSTQTKASTLITKTETQRKSLHDRISAAEVEEADAKVLIEDALSEFKKATECVSLELSNAIMPFLSVSISVHELTKQVENYKTMCTIQNCDLKSLHTELLTLADVSYTMRCMLIALNSVSPSMDETYEKVISMIRQCGSVKFQEPMKVEQSQHIEDNEELAQPLNATFCVPSTSASGLFSVTTSLKAPQVTVPPPATKVTDTTFVLTKKRSTPPTEVTNLRVPSSTLNPPPTKTSRISPTLRKAGEATAPRVARPTLTTPVTKRPSFAPASSGQRSYVARPGSSSGRRRRTPLRNNFKKFKKPFAVKPINYNKENSSNSSSR